MSKEIKIGLSVIGGLLLILGGTLYWRLSYSKPRLVVDAELVESSDKPQAATKANSASFDQLTDTASGADRWARPAERSAADYRRASASGADTATDIAQNAYATNGSDETSADHAADDQETNPSADTDTRAADPFQQRRVAAASSDSETDATDNAAPQQFEPAGETVSPLTEPSDSSTAADSTGDNQSAIPVAAREPIAPLRSIARNPKARPVVAETNQQMIADEAAVAAPRPRRSYLQDEESQESTDTEHVDQSSPDAAPADGISSRVEVADGKYTVQPNDNYWVISEKLYGNAGYFKALQAFNRSRFPQHASELAVGDMIAAPAAEELMKTYPNLCPKPRKLPPEHLAKQASSRHPLGAKVYVVEEGDTLFDVARYELGKASRWAEIYDLNRDVLGEDFDYLKPGTQLVLPTERRNEDRMTRQPATRKLR